MQDEQDTLAVARAEAPDILVTTYELRLTQADHGTQVVPIRRAVTRLGSEVTCDLCLPCSPSVVFGLVGDRLHFSNLTPDLPIYLDGQATTSGELGVGDSICAGPAEIMFWDRTAGCYLEGSSPPFVGRIWPLGLGRTRVGRQGLRPNEISIENSTISRAQATLEVEESECEILSESQTNPVVLNGQLVEAGERRSLKGGDLIEFGRLAFYFRQAGTTQKTKLFFSFFGCFTLATVQHGNPVSDAVWKTKPIKWLMAMLGFEGGKPVSNERLIQAIWPDSDCGRGRDRLNASCSTIRQVLAKLAPGSSLADALWRSSTAVQLNPGVLGTSDVVELRAELEAVQQFRRGGCFGQAQAAYRRALCLVQRPFLEGCELEWASGVRYALEHQVCEVGRGLASSQMAVSDFEGALAVAGLVLKIEACCQVSMLIRMRALRQLGRGAETVRSFELFRQRLKTELDLEPGLELLDEVGRLD